MDSLTSETDDLLNVIEGIRHRKQKTDNTKYVETTETFNETNETNNKEPGFFFYISKFFLEYYYNNTLSLCNVCHNRIILSSPITKCTKCNNVFTPKKMGHMGELLKNKYSQSSSPSIHVVYLIK